MENKSLTEIFTTDGIRFSLIGMFSILSLFLLAQTITLARDFGRSGAPATDTITVNGDGQATMAPDVARITFTVQNTAVSVAEAQAVTTRQANGVLDFVKKQSIAEKDVKTLSYNINPQYAYPAPCVGSSCPERTPKITGYQVSETVQVTVRDLAKAGELLAGLGEFGVQNVSGPDFALDDSTAGYDAARADAIAKAKVQASVLAQQLGVHLGKIVNFSESSGGYPVPMMYAKGFGGAMEASAPTPNLPVGENTYHASVSITYEIR